MVSSRHILFALYILVVAVMAAATFVEKYRGTDFAHASVYGSWWFTGLWAALALAAVVCFVRRHVRRPSVVVLHLSLAVILLGALLTRTTAWRGAVKLRTGAVAETFFVMDSRGDVSQRRLPFKLRLDAFEIRYHDGTEAEADYVSRFTVIDDGRETAAEVSMNNVCAYRGVRFYQSSYDPDMRGSVLSMNSDPWGMPVTYVGYGLLFLSLAWMLADPRGAFRRLLRSPLLWRGVLSVAALVALSGGARAATVLPEETAEKFGRLNVLYNNRVCPMQTLAVDFTKKLCGSPRYGGYTPEQVLTGFIFWGDEWCAEPVIRMKNGPLREQLQLPRYCSLNTFFNASMGGYILGPYLRGLHEGQNDKFHKQVGDIDDRLMMVMNLRQGKLLKVFPVTIDGKTKWYAPTDNVVDTLVGEAEKAYFKDVFPLIYQYAMAGDTAAINLTLDKMLKHQRQNGGTSMPSDLQVKAERAYNAVPFATILFMINLTAGFILLGLTIWRMMRNPSRKSSQPHNLKTRQPQNLKTSKPQNPTTSKPHNPTTSKPHNRILLTLSLLALTACIALRWVIGGRVPMANGYETMLLVAWFVMLMALVAERRFRIAVPFGFLMSGFFLLVSHISYMDPQITHVMPVLSSPLLSLHVSVIMMAFALLSITFVCGLTALLLRRIRGRRASGLNAQLESLALLSRLMLYPALALLGIGIFVGAVWANVSWGAYWNWDAKEVWGLITFMVYAVAAHEASLPFLRRPAGYHLYMVLAFLTIIMTYFGVNYFLGGMHSYA